MTGARDCFYTAADGLKLFYRDYPGPPGALPVLCLPGLTRNSADFENLALHLQDRHRVLTPDMRGRGRSEYAKDPATYTPLVYVQDMARLLRHAGIARAAVIGTSLGGLMAMLMAGLMRHRLAAVVLNDVGPALDANGIARIRAYVGKMGPFASWEQAAAQARAIGAVAFPHYGDAEWRAFARRSFTERNGQIVVDYDPNIAAPLQQPGAAAPDLWPMFDALAGIPTLAIRGQTSDILSEETFKAMQARHPAMAALTIAGVGHAPSLDEPPARAAIDILLSGVPARLSALHRLKARYDAWRHMARAIKAMRG